MENPLNLPAELEGLVGRLHLEKAKAETPCACHEAKDFLLSKDEKLITPENDQQQ